MIIEKVVGVRPWRRLDVDLDIVSSDPDIAADGGWPVIWTVDTDI